jgi:uncharacterized membrane protein YvlD (DUF360 family)
VGRVLAVWAVASATLAALAGILPDFRLEAPGGDSPTHIAESAALGAGAFGLLSAVVWPLVVRALLLVPALALGLLVFFLNGAVLVVAWDLAPGWRGGAPPATAVLIAAVLSATSSATSTALAVRDDAAYGRRLARLAGRRRRDRGRPGGDGAPPGTLFLQLDGVGHDVLCEAVRPVLRGGRVRPPAMPTVAGWIGTSHRLLPWRTDWSSQTGASQLALLHGSNEDVPAFRWYEKDPAGGPGHVMVCNRPSSAAELERRAVARTGDPGLLAVDGAGRGNLFSGGATQLALVMSVTAQRSRVAGRRPTWRERLASLAWVVRGGVRGAAGGGEVSVPRPPRADEDATPALLTAASQASGAVGVGSGVGGVSAPVPAVGAGPGASPALASLPAASAGPGAGPGSVRAEGGPGAAPGAVPDSEAEPERLPGPRSRSGYFAYFSDPANAVRTAASFAAEVVREVCESTAARARREGPRVSRGGLYPVLRAFATVVERDVAVAAVVGDMLAGRTAIYADLVAYDEVAHHSGPRSRDALRVLRRLDRSVGLIAQSARYAPRPYRVVLLSDHGQSAGRTFAAAYGLTLRELVRVGCGLPVPRRARRAATGAEARTAARAALRRPEHGGRAGRQEREEAAGPPSEPVVLASGNLGLVSFPDIPGRATAEEIERRHPALLPALADHPGIGFLLVRSAERGPLVLGAAGACRELDSGRVTGADPLAPFGPGAVEAVRRTAGFPHAADIMVNSAYDPVTGEVHAFEEQVGSHGGLGGEQSRPFLLHPVELPTPQDPLVGAEQVHRVLRGWLGR